MSGVTLLGGIIMEIDGIFTIVVGVAALLSPIIVAIQTSKQTKKELIINSRFEWIKSTKKILDDYVKKLHEYSASEEVDLNLINEVIELKTKLELQFKPYEIREKNIEINDTTTDSDNFENVKAYIEKTYKENRRIMSNDDLEALLLDFLNVSQIILEESYKNKVIYRGGVNFLIDEIVLLQIGIQKNEWDRINLIEKSFFNNFFEEVNNMYKKLINKRVKNYTEVTLKNVNHVIKKYIEKSKNNHDAEKSETTRSERKTSDGTQNKVLPTDGFDFTFEDDDTVPKYMNRKLKEMMDKDFEFKELYGKRGHKYLVKSTTEDASVGFARFRDFIDKNGDKWFYDVNLTPDESVVVIQNIFNKKEVLTKD